MANFQISIIYYYYCYINTDIITYISEINVVIGQVVLALESCVRDEDWSFLDGVVGPFVLYVVNTKNIIPDDILTLRKRMSTPLTTPLSETMLQVNYIYIYIYIYLYIYIYIYIYVIFLYIYIYVIIYIYIYIYIGYLCTSCVTSLSGHFGTKNRLI